MDDDDTNELSYEQLRPFRCKLCSNSFPTKHSLKLHTDVYHSNAGIFECRKCDFRCDRMGIMTFHTQRHIHDQRHSITPDETHSKPLNEHETQAKIPSLVIKLDKNKLNISQNSVAESLEGQQKYSNNDLDSEYKDQEHLGVNKAISKSDGNFLCEICKKRFTQRARFQKHMMIKHTEVKSIQIGSKLDGEHIRCLVCHKLFASKGTLKRHMLIHTGEMPFECTKCDAKYNQNIRLQQHMMKDHGEGLFKCNKCDESFIQCIHLQRHMAAHTGNKPFSCTKCDAGFAMHRDLKRHMILGHIQKNPFQCRKRGNKLLLKRFVSKPTKKNHTTININITVNSEKYLKCMKCKESVKYSELKSHMDMHQNAFRCEHCNRIFLSQHSLKIHKAKSHRKKSINTDLELEPEYENSQSEENSGNQSYIDISQNDFRCDICNRPCHSMRSLNIHKAKAHKEYIKNTELDLKPEYKNTQSEENTVNQSQINIDQNDFRCEICNRACHSIHGLNIHKGRTHKEYIKNTDLDLKPDYKNAQSEENTGNQLHIKIDQKDFRCEICNRACHSMHGLNIHKGRAHKEYVKNTDLDLKPEYKNTLSEEHTGNKSHIDIVQNDFRCEICNKICHSMHGINIHKAKAHKEVIKNTDLDLKSEYKNTLSEEHTGNKSHIDIGQNNFRCEICNRICHSMHGLNIHKAKAHKEYSNNIKINMLPEVSSETDKEHKDTMDLKIAYQMQNSDLEVQKTEDKKWQVKSCEEGGKLKIKLQTNSREG